MVSVAAPAVNIKPPFTAVMSELIAIFRLAVSVNVFTDVHVNALLIVISPLPAPADAVNTATFVVAKFPNNSLAKILAVFVDGVYVPSAKLSFAVASPLIVTSVGSSNHIPV